MTERIHRIYFIPGMFGFGRLAGYDYFEHLEQYLGERFSRAGARYEMHVVPTPPTASIRRRAVVVAQQVARSAGGDEGPIHLVGHSTGGLDARLIASPSVSLDLPDPEQAWVSRLETVTTLNTPHYGTPLAQFFTSVSGTRLLYALSLLTFTTLRFGGPSLTVFSSLIATLGRLDETLGIDIQLLDRATDLVLRFIGDQGREEVHDWLDGIRQDQGGIVQITPEAMDIFNAATEDSPRVRYGSIATASPAPTPIRMAARVRSPYAAFSATIYTTLYTVTSREHKRYPSPPPDSEAAAKLAVSFGPRVSGSLSDGIVPTLSMLWGDLLWTGAGDHLDVVGHFDDTQKPRKHVDWLHSGAHFSRKSFAQAVDALAIHLLGNTPR